MKVLKVLSVVSLAMIIFTGQTVAKNIPAKSKSISNLSLSKQKASKSLKAYNAVKTSDQEVLILNEGGGWAIYYDKKNKKPKVKVVHDSILSVSYDLQAGGSIILRRQFVSPKDLSSYSGVSFFWQVDETPDAEAYLSFTLCDLENFADLGKKADRTWSYVCPEYVLSNTSGKWYECKNAFTEFKPASVGSTINTNLIDAYQISVHSDKAAKGKFSVRSFCTF
jgi:hypothetical protein